MRLRKHVAALALACAAGSGAANSALGQSAPVRSVQVTPLPAEPATAADANPAAAPTPAEPARPSDEQRAIELYRAHFGGELTKATYLGVSTSAVPAALRQHLGLPEGVGLVVDFVEPDSPAQAAGLKQYDILKRLDDQILVNAPQLAVLLRSRKAGDEVMLVVVRGGKEQPATAKLVEKEVKALGDIFQDWPATGRTDLNTRQIEVRNRMKARRARDPSQDRRGSDHQLKNGSPDKRPPDEKGSAGGGHTISVWRDNEMTLTMSKMSDKPGRHLLVTEKAGNIVFDGNLDDKDDRAKLPPHVAEKVRQMETKIPPGNGGPKDVDVEFRGQINSNSDSFHFEDTAEFGHESDRGNDGEPGLKRDIRVETKFEGKTDANPDAGPETKNDVDVQIDRSPSSKGPIGPNDLLHIAIADVHGHGVETVKTTRVREGLVRLPYVAPIACEGLTEGELEKQIVSAYADAKVAPNVTVSVRKVPRSGKPSAEGKSEKQ